jgi:cell division protein FtsQ
MSGAVLSSSGRITTTKKIRISKKKNRTSRKKYVILFMIIGIIFLTLFSPMFNIKYIEVTDNSLVADESIIDLSGINENMNVFRANIYRAEKNIFNIPYVEDVLVKRKLPNGIEIIVNEREPVGYIPFIMGSYILIDKKGFVLEVIPEEIDNLPLIMGIEYNNQFELGSILQANDTNKFDIIVSIVNEMGNNNLLNSISYVDIYDINNVQLNIKENIQVNIGDGLQIRYKMSFLKEVLDELGDNEKGYIDLSENEKVTFRPTQ